MPNPSAPLLCVTGCGGGGGCWVTGAWANAAGVLSVSDARTPRINHEIDGRLRIWCSLKRRKTLVFIGANLKGSLSYTSVCRVLAAIRLFRALQCVLSDARIHCGACAIITGSPTDSHHLCSLAPN